MRSISHFQYISESKEIIASAKKDIQLSYTSNKEHVFVNADRDRICQVISNLVNNAVRFTKCGAISLIVEQTGDEVAISVSDTGTGIDTEIIPRLFHKFATKSVTGTGLGLFISKSIVEAHGGEISALNNTNGSGATFKFVLPLIAK